MVFYHFRLYDLNSFFRSNFFKYFCYAVDQNSVSTKHMLIVNMLKVQFIRNTLFNNMGRGSF